MPTLIGRGFWGEAGVFAPPPVDRTLVWKEKIIAVVKLKISVQPFFIRILHLVLNLLLKLRFERLDFFTLDVFFPLN